MSGFSWSGGQPRCFAYWQEFQKCYAKSDHPAQCGDQAGDYVECLHGQKAKERQEEIQAELQRKIQKAAKHASDGPATSASVGLIKREGGGEPSSK